MGYTVGGHWETPEKGFKYIWNHGWYIDNNGIKHIKL